MPSNPLGADQNPQLPSETGSLICRAPGNENGCRASLQVPSIRMKVMDAEQDRNTTYVEHQ